MNNNNLGRFGCADHATHKQSQQAVSAVPVSVPSAWYAIAVVAHKPIDGGFTLGRALFFQNACSQVEAEGFGYRLAGEQFPELITVYVMATECPAQGIEARSDETLQAAQPEGQEPGGEAMRPSAPGASQ